jgi:hypothetical protein
VSIATRQPGEGEEDAGSKAQRFGRWGYCIDQFCTIPSGLGRAQLGGIADRVKRRKRDESHAWQGNGYPSGSRGTPAIVSSGWEECSVTWRRSAPSLVVSSLVRVIGEARESSILIVGCGTSSLVCLRLPTKANPPRNHCF